MIRRLSSLTKRIPTSLNRLITYHPTLIRTLVLSDHINLHRLFPYLALTLSSPYPYPHAHPLTTLTLPFPNRHNDEFRSNIGCARRVDMVVVSGDSGQRAEGVGRPHLHCHPAGR